MIYKKDLIIKLEEAERELSELKYVSNRYNYIIDTIAKDNKELIKKNLSQRGEIVRLLEELDKTKKSKTGFFKKLFNKETA